jgi:nitrite reductase/ring-hydroxylating ferredoxin subunit
VTPLCATSALLPGQPVLVRLAPTTSVILLRLADGELVAYRNACPHMGTELDWEPRRLLTQNGRYLHCTGHGAWFEPSTGMCVRGPCTGEALTPLPIHIENEMVMTP